MHLWERYQSAHTPSSGHVTTVNINQAAYALGERFGHDYAQEYPAVHPWVLPAPMVWMEYDPAEYYRGMLDSFPTSEAEQALLMHQEYPLHTGMLLRSGDLRIPADRKFAEGVLGDVEEPETIQRLLRQPARYLLVAAFQEGPAAGDAYALGHGLVFTDDRGRYIPDAWSTVSDQAVHAYLNSGMTEEEAVDSGLNDVGAELMLAGYACALLGRAEARLIASAPDGITGTVHHELVLTGGGRNS